MSSCFAAVHEPYEGEPFVEEVRAAEAKGPLDAVVLAVEHHGFTDYIVHRADVGDEPTIAGDLQVVGDAAFVRVREGRPEMMALWGGTELRWKDCVLQAGGSYRGKVLRTLRKEGGDPYDGLAVRGSVPNGDSLEGATVIVTLGDGSTVGYPITRVGDVQSDTCLILKDDPGIAVDAKGMRHLFCPRRRIPGPVRYRVRTSTCPRLDPTTGGMEVAPPGVFSSSAQSAPA